MYTIKHTPFNQTEEKFATIDIESVEKLYVGKGNCCRCGCRGEYYYLEQYRDKIQRSLKKMASGKYQIESIEDYIFDMTISETYDDYGDLKATRVHTIYLKEK
jgi:hypothetical protein